ncbi:MAG: ABC transporter ATP-binding protein [Clostridia bacterium]
MTKLFKYMKNSAFAIVLIFGLLIVQAICDLSLPDYTARIVDTGIQLGGIEKVSPDIIRQSTLEKVYLFLNEEDKAIVEESFDKKDISQMNENEKNDFIKKYPTAENEVLFSLNVKDKKELEKLDQILSTPFMLLEGLQSENEQSSQMQEKMLAGIKSQIQNSSKLDEDIVSKMTPQQIEALKQQQQEQIDKLEKMSFIDILSSLQPSQRSEIVASISKTFNEMPQSIVLQGAKAYTKTEYVACGVDSGNMQTMYIIFAGLKMLGLALLSMIATIIVGYLGAKVAAKLGKDLRGKVFKKVVSFSNNEFEKFSTASLITRSTNDIQQIQMLMVMLLRVVFYAPIMAIGGVIKVLNTNNSMAWIIAVAVVVILMIVLVLFALVMPKFKLVQKLIDKLNLVTREILTGLPVIRAFSTEKHEQKRFEKANGDLTKTNLFVNRMMSGMMPMMMLVMNLVSVGIIWFGASGIDTGAMQVGDLIAFIQYSMQIIMSFLMISMVSIMLPRASISAIRVDEIIKTNVIIKDIENPKQFKNDSKGLVEFKNVNFKYPDADEDVLTNISFTAKPGETTAFIGSTGSGKSTLINLIPRFFDVTDGEILIDGINVKEVSQKKLREKIGFVPQKGILFSGTIESNIKYGNDKMTDEQMRKAAEVAQALNFIEEKETTFESEISQGGTNVSGGQKQRLSIARAIAINPEIYIFDDSFSALDYKTDIALRKALKKHTSNSTVLIVAQRISTILHAEQIIVLDEGVIVGKGTHKELLQSCEVYKQIASSQLSKEELGNE